MSKLCVSLFCFLSFCFSRSQAVNETNGFHTTLLHEVAAGGRSHAQEIASILIDHGAGVNSQNNNEETPLDTAGRSLFVAYV